MRCVRDVFLSGASTFLTLFTELKQLFLNLGCAFLIVDSILNYCTPSKPPYSLCATAVQNAS